MNEILKDIKEQYQYNDWSQKIIFWNIGLFVLSLPFFYEFKLGFFSFPNFIALNSNPNQFLFFPWTLLSYAFFHSGLGHLLSNMFFLFFAGKLFFTFFNNKQFLTTYFLGAFFAGLIYILCMNVLGIENQLVGASAAILAVFFTVVFYSPLMIVRIPLIGFVKLWYIGAVLLGINLVYFAVENMGGNVAHLAGVLFAFINVQSLKRGVDFSKWFDFSNKKKKSTFKKVYKNGSKPTVITKTESNNDLTQQKIDDILDKISKSGYESLTKEEKEFLFKINK